MGDSLAFNAAARPSVLAMFRPGISRGAADGRYVKKNAAQVATTDYAFLGATNPGSGAVRIDAGSFAGNAVIVSNGATVTGGVLSTGTANFQIGAATGVSFDLRANSLPKFRVVSEAAGQATMLVRETIGRIVGGGGNFLFRDGADANTNITVTDAGALTARASITAGASNAAFIVDSRLTFGSGSDGVAIMRNAAQTDFNRLQLGGTTSAFPSWKRSGAGIEARLADDSGYAAVTGAIVSGSMLHARGAASNPGAGVLALGTSSQTTVGAAGAASALPANPSGYLRFFLGTSEFVFPYYAQA